MGCSDVLRQFILLLWKNFILQIRRPIGTVFEIIIPLFAVLFIIALKYVIFNSEQECFVTFPSDTLTLPSTNIPEPLVFQNYTIYYTPNNNDTEDIAGLIEKRLTNGDVSVTFQGFNNTEELLAALKGLPEQNISSSAAGCLNGGAGLVFDNLEGGDLAYTIRLRHEVGNADSWNTKRAGAAFQLPGARFQNSYLSEGFLHLQSAVDQSLIQWKTGQPTNFSIDVKQFPYPPYLNDLFLQSIAGVLPLFMVLAFLYSAGIFVKELVLEKETRIRESMLMMGLSQWILWSTWYLKQFIFLFISILIMTILIKVAVFPRSDFVLLLVFFFLFTLSSISWGFLVSVWFNTARVGLLVGFLAWFINFLPFFFIGALYDTGDIDLAGKIASCIPSNTALGLGVTVIARLEIRLEGLQWDNAAKPLSSDDDFHMGYVFMMLILDAIVYYVIAWYVNAVKPGQYGVPKPLYFPFLLSYWIGRPLGGKNARDMADYDENGIDPSVDPTAFETEPSDLEVGISIQNLSKVYDSFLMYRKKAAGRKVAVKSMNVNMYKGQITALLGHNGAGKTTTISMLTGLYTPTSGTAMINGHSIVTDMDQIRRSLGICPQHNVLFDRLTVWEHLSFFCRLKGIWGARMKQEVMTMITDLQLLDKKQTAAKRLSGGMKRKLSVGIALVGGSEIVILDEPTSGMDPYARRATWDLLIKHREGRTVLLTTHFMDEADLLGDRIAIMSEGRLRCSGSSLFLKSKYGVGYHMVVVKEADCNSAKVTELVKSFVRGAKQVTDVGAELSLILPSAATSSFPALFEALEAQKGELGVSSFGISVTTMEEVFIKVGEGSAETMEDRKEHLGTLSFDRHRGLSTATKATRDMETRPAQVNFEEADITAAEPVDIEMEGGQGHTEETQFINTSTPLYTPNSGIVLWVQQFCAIFLKRVYNSIRFWAALISQLFLPMVFVLLALSFALTLPDPNEGDPSRVLTIENSGLSRDIDLFYSLYTDISGIDFSRIKPSSLGAASITDYTADVQAIMNQTMANNYNDSSQCCNYDYQLLDQFCATRTANDLDCNQDSFGYKHCKDCLSCCDSQNSVLPSCTHPLLSLGGLPDEFCPAAPVVTLNTDPTGILESYNTYVDEHILMISDDVADPNAFFRRTQAGFVVSSKRDAAFSYCGCDCSPTCPYSPTFTSPTNDSSGCLYYEVEPGSTCSTEALPACYNVDGLSGDIFKIVAQSEFCNESDSTTIAAKSPVQAERTDQVAVTVWYNNQPFHMTAAALNAFDNIWLRSVLGADNVSITVSNHPLPRNITAQADQATTSGDGLSISTLTVFGFSFLVATFVLSLVQEKERKAKHLQFVSGVHSTSYWAATFAWDLINGLLPIVVSVILFAAFQVDAYTGDGLAAVFFLLFFTVWASIPLTYCVSFIFSNPLAAFGVLMLFYYFVGFILQVIVFVVEGQDGPDTADRLHYIFLLMPSYGLAVGLQDVYSNSVIKQICTQNERTKMFCEHNDDLRYVDSPLEFDRPGVGSILLYMAIEGVLFFLFTLIIERSFFISDIKSLFLRNGKPVLAVGPEDPEDHGPTEPLLIHGEDTDVYNERRKVLKGETDENDVVVLKGLMKVYSRSLDGCSLQPPKTAVRGISLVIPKGECFGLLGVNGAGKTTTFSILTGDISMTDGTAIIAGYDIRTHLKEVQQRIGYCPQFDALLERLTGRELLTMFARLRGIPEQYIKEVVDTEIKRLDLAKHADKRCGKYSGGNKRKLSTAIALVGNPPIVLLDEPTTGMDPVTRRFLWDVLTTVTQEGRSIILTSHSMEECEALCTRLAIMVNGSFKCLGSIQHLKNKYGAGFTLQAKVMLSAPTVPTLADTRFSPQRQLSKESSLRGSPFASPETSLIGSPTTARSDVPLGGSRTFQPYDTTSLHIFIREAFHGAVLLEEHQGAVTYHLPSAGVSWSSVFRQLENNKERLGIVDYSVSQTTLEQVFINFAKEQQEEED